MVDGAFSKGEGYSDVRDCDDSFLDLPALVFDMAARSLGGAWIESRGDLEKYERAMRGGIAARGGKQEGQTNECISHPDCNIKRITNKALLAFLLESNSSMMVRVRSEGRMVVSVEDVRPRLLTTNRARNANPARINVSRHFILRRLTHHLTTASFVRTVSSLHRARPETRWRTASRPIFLTNSFRRVRLFGSSSQTVPPFANSMSVDADRRKANLEKLAQEMLGKKGRASAPPSGPKGGLGASLASRIGVTKVCSTSRPRTTAHTV